MALSYDSLKEVLLPLPQTGDLPRTLRGRNQQRKFVVLGLVLVDAIALLVTFALVYLLRFKLFGFLYVPKGSVLNFYSELVFWTIPPWIAVLAFNRLYDLRKLHGGGTIEYRLITSSCTFAIIMLLAASFFMDDKLVISRAWLLMVWFTSILMLILSRLLSRSILTKLHKRGLALTQVLLVGTNSETLRLAAQLSEGRNSPGMELVGFVGERRSRPRLPIEQGLSVFSNSDIEGYNRSNQREVMETRLPGRWLGQISDVRRVVDLEHIDEVIITNSALSSDELFDVVRSLTTSKVELRLSPSLYDILTTSLEVQEINGLPLVTVNKVRITGLNAYLKRAMDILVSSSILLIFSPILLMMGILVRLDSPGPAVYRRRVIGQGGQLFNAFKFRTMRLNGDEILAANPQLLEELERTGKLKNDPRITRLGKFLRKTSLDELPQLVNVLYGQMSLVGPRMITYQEMSNFGRWQSNLLTVKPGLTGLWQVRGRSDLTYAERVRLDMHYIRNYTLWNDLCILFQTIPAVLRGSGAY